MKHNSYRSGELSLTEGQVQRLLESVTELSDLCLLKIALSVGLRRSDIVTIKSADVNFEKSELTFYEQKKNRTKTVPLPDSTLKTLRMWCNINRSPFLFPAKRVRTLKTGHISSRYAYDVLQRCLKRAGLPSRPFHALRATCVKMCQKRGWSPEQSAKLLGDRVSTIQQHYTTPSDEEMKEVMKEKGVI